MTDAVSVQAYATVGGQRVKLTDGAILPTLAWPRPLPL
jgi:hypothetical protein